MFLGIVIFVVLLVMSFFDFKQGKETKSFARVCLTLYVSGLAALHAIG